MTKINNTRGPKEPPNTTDFDLRFVSPEIEVKKLNTMIFKRGIRVQVYSIIPCPNVKSIDGREHEISCPLCHGKGFIDLNPIDTYAFAASFNKDLQKNSESIGTEVEEGTCYFSFIAGVNLTYFSKILLSDFSKPYYEHVQRQRGSADKLRYPAISVSALVDKNGVEYTEGVNFDVDEGMVKWKSGKGPSETTIYSINYHCNVIYRAISAVHQGRYGSTDVKRTDMEVLEFQENWKVRLDYLVTQTREDGTVIDPNVIYPPNE